MTAKGVSIMYVALKACKFAGKAYKIGETIDQSVVLREAAPRLIKMGVLAAVGENRIHLSATDSVEGGPTPPPSLTSDKATVYTKGALSHMNKEELLNVAKEKGVKATAEMKNAEIIDLIIEKQGE